MASEPALPRLTVCTAGPHGQGKTTLARAVSSIDPTIAFVDPSRFVDPVRALLAARPGLHAAVLTISPLDGVTEETREQLAVLDILGITQGVIAITRVDLYDAELRALAEADAASLIVGSCLAKAPILPISTRTGEGVSGLVEALQAMRVPPHPPVGPLRLPIEGTTVRSGLGTLVTGTVQSGVLHEGDLIKLQPGGQVARARGFTVSGEASQWIEAGQQVSLLLPHLELEEVPPGTMLTRGTLPFTSTVDVTYIHLARTELQDGQLVHLLTAGAGQEAHIRLMSEAGGATRGDRAYAQLRLQVPTACLPGDRFFVRSGGSPPTLLGGGVILDPWATELRPERVAATVAELRRLEAGDPQPWLERAGERGLEVADWQQRAPTGASVLLGDRVFSSTVVARLEGLLVGALAEFHASAPHSLGAHRQELRQGRLNNLSDRAFEALVDRLAGRGAVQVDGPLVRATAYRASLTPAQVALKGAITEAVAEAGLAALTPEALAARFADPAVEALTRQLTAEGALLLLPGLGLIASVHLRQLDQRLREHFSRHEQLTPLDLKEITSLTRKSAMALLTWLDATGRTRRVHEAHARGPALG
jgi:selenocysteine-specific elongation factor